MESSNKVLLRQNGEGRRRFLRLSPLLLLAGCDLTPDGNVESILKKAQGFNDWVQEKVFSPTKLAPEYSDAEITPIEGFRVNGFGDTPEIDLENWALTVEGIVQKPGEYTMEQIYSLPKKMMNVRHCCVEGWSMIPKWGGTTLRGFLQMAGADMKAKYLSVQCGDEYYTSYDMPSALHPQTLLAYEAYNKPLDADHGAPLRIVMPTKLGYKSAKWVTKLIVTNDKPGGYWEDQGYDWFGGI